jgi:hypothetical protein
MTEDVRKTNLNAEGKVLESQASAIANIMARANEQAQQEIANKRNAKKSGYEATVAYNRELPAKRKAYAVEIADNLLSQGLDYSALSSAEMKQLQGLGINQQDIISAYLSKKNEQDAAQAETDWKREGEQLSRDKIGFDMSLAEKKFEEDKRQFGMNYALAQQKAEKDTPTKVDPQNAMSQIELAKKSLKNAKELANASGSTSWFTGAARAVAGARPIDNLTAETNTLRTNVLTMATDPAIKKFFGPQMSNADVQLMTAAGTTLNPELQSPKQMKEELARLEDFIARAEKAVREGQSQTVNTPAISGQVMVSGVLYNVDDNGDMTPAN